MAPDPPLQEQQQQQARRFRNTYWLLRHGRSTANERDLIVSRPEEGAKPEWGLTAEGRTQAAAAGRRLRQQLEEQAGGWDPAALLLLASPFSRTLQTALEAGAALGVAEGDPRLQVRLFLRLCLRVRLFDAPARPSGAGWQAGGLDGSRCTGQRPHTPQPTPCNAPGCCPRVFLCVVPCSWSRRCGSAASARTS